MIQALVIILFVLAIVSCSIQFSLFPIKKVIWGWLAGISVYVYLMYQQAIEQSYSVFREMLSNSTLMTDFTVLQVIEAIGGILLSIYLIRFHFKERVKSIYQYFVYLPGIILFPAIFYIESYLFLQITGMNFQGLAICLAIAIPALILLMKWGITSLIPEFDLRLELKFALHIIQLVNAVILSVFLLRLPVKTVNIDSPINQILTLLFVLFVFVAVGALWYNFRMKQLLNNDKNE